MTLLSGKGYLSPYAAFVNTSLSELTNWLSLLLLEPFHTMPPLKIKNIYFERLGQLDTSFSGFRNLIPFTNEVLKMVFRILLMKTANSAFKMGDFNITIFFLDSSQWGCKSGERVPQLAAVESVLKDMC